MYAFVIRRSSSELIVSDQATMQCLRSGSQEAPMATGARLPLQLTIHRAAVPASNGNSYVLNARYRRERPPDPPADTTQFRPLAALPAFQKLPFIHRVRKGLSGRVIDREYDHGSEEAAGCGHPRWKGRRGAAL